MTLPHHPYDSFFKELFSRPEAAEDFVCHYLPPEVMSILEPESLTIAKDSFVDETLAEHYSDLLYRVQLKVGKDVYIYLLFEHKSAPAPRVALDLLRYLVRIWDFLGKKDLGSAAEMPKEDLKRAAIQALPEGEQLMATPAEQWIQEGLEQGEKCCCDRYVAVLARLRSSKVRGCWQRSPTPPNSKTWARCSWNARMRRLG
jgi:putative YhgA-like transposase